MSKPSLEDNQRVMALGETSAAICERMGLNNCAAVMRMLVESLRHTHEIATAGWLETSDEK